MPRLFVTFTLLYVGFSFRIGMTTLRADDSSLSWSKEKHSLPRGVSESLSGLIKPEAVVVQRPDRQVLLQLWLRDELPSRATSEQIQNGLTYRELPLSTFVGLIEFPQHFVDSRKQSIKAGVYTLRYALQPETADHLEVTPHRDFLVLTPVEEDTSPDLLEPRALIEKSAAMTGGDHPAVMMLWPAHRNDPSTGISKRGNHFSVIVVGRKVTSPAGDSVIRLVLTIKGSFSPDVR